MNKTEVTPKQQAFAEYIAKEANARHKRELASMTPEKAVGIIREAASMLGDHDYLSAEHMLHVVAEWLETQQKEHKQ